ncbi:MAG: xylose isomerase, partial [Thermoguttaceae bacterium]|nr:xylose isomerase [Thermoguttaceae bacterium]
MPAFADIQTIKYEGPDSKNPLAFRHYNAGELVEGKPMKDHLRFSVAYWHTMRGTGSDPFGPGTMLRPWEGQDTVENAVNRIRVFFEFCEKLGAPYFCFHDRDVAPEGKSLAESNKNLDAVVKVIKEEQARTGIKLLWGTANLFSNPRYMHGAATSPNSDAFAYAAAQVKKALEVTKELGGEGYVFWGGREGYMTLWNTNMKRELDHLARFMHMAVDYAKEIGFTGQFYFEPKPKEPTKHQYDFDAAACINFLRAYGLGDRIKLNIETNHATLAGHTVEHELEYAGHQGFLGSVDANTGDLLLGWDTDQFPTDVYMTAKIMLAFLKYGGIAPGGVNFDAKVRRESFEPVDLFYAHIGGMDTFAKGLKIAAAMRASGEIDAMVKDRYSSWDSGVGAEIEAGKHSFKTLE